jgi:hydroxyacylglutathione hydrolase
MRRVLRVGPFDTNSYVSARDRAVLIDPGAEPEALLEALSETGLPLAGVILSHGHIDHVGALPELWEELGPFPIAIHPADAASLGPGSLALHRGTLARLGAESLLSAFLSRDCPAPSYAMRSGQVPFAPWLLALETPGHSPGSVCLYDAEEGIIYSGDTLFRDGLGRTDLEGGDAEAILASIRKVLFALPKETEVLPGHGAPTSLGREASWLS